MTIKADIRCNAFQACMMILAAFLIIMPGACIQAKEQKIYSKLNKSLLNVSPAKDKMTLGDGSVWEIKDDDQRKAGLWMKEDNLRIEPQKDDRFDISIRNMSTNETIQAVMVVPPVESNPATRKVTRIFAKESRVVLSDGSAWKLSNGTLNSSETSRQWSVGDVIIVGYDAASGSGNDFPYVLINTKQQERSNARLD